MTPFDYVLLAVIGVSMLLALMRGLVAEVLSLSSWLIALWVAKEYAPLIGEFLPLPGDGLRLIGGFVVLLLATWLLTALVRAMLGGVIDAVGLSGLNRFFGLAFGLVRGLVLATVLVLLGGLSDLPKKPVWQDALLAQPFEHVALSLRPWLPVALAERIRFS